MTVLDNSVETKRRLLEAAGEVFAEHGFRKATVREICKRAKANVAAISYHFRDKESLYSAVLKYWSDIAIQKYPPNLGLNETAPAEERLHAFIRSFLFRVLDEGRPAWHGKLMAREMAEPTPVFDGIVESVCKPLSARLTSIVQELAGSETGAESVRLCVGSIIGQCLFYHHCQPVNAKLWPEQRFDAEGIERLADHITQFSLNALKGLANPEGALATVR
jgi:AcrR family transcriptional regulator